MGHIIPSWSEVEMPNHLHRLLEENSDLMGQVIEIFLPSSGRYPTRWFCSAASREATRPPLEGDDLYYAVEKIRMLIKIVVLKELAFGDDDVQATFKRNRQFAYLKTV